MQVSRMEANDAKEIIKKSSEFINDSVTVPATAGVLESLYTYFEPEVIRTVYADVPYAKGEVIAVDTKTPEWADKITYQRVDRNGLFSRVDADSTRENTISLASTDLTYDVAYYGASFKLNVVEARKAGAPNLVYNIEEEKIRAIEESAQETLNLLMALGDVRIPGHLNHFDAHRLILPYRLDNQPSGGVISTDQQKLDGLMLALRIYNDSFGRYRPNRIVAQHSVQTDMAKPRLTSTNDTRPILEVFTTSYPELKAKGITAVPQCIGAGRLGANGIPNDVVVFYNDAPTVATGKVTMPLRIFPYQYRNYAMHAYGLFGFSGIHLLQPLGHLIVEMPAAD